MRKTDLQVGGPYIGHMEYPSISDAELYSTAHLGPHELATAYSPRVTARS
jgi:hypothetical protein